MHILSSSTFRIVDHVVPCQHIREYPAATVHTQEDTLYLAVKQYIPHDNQFPRPGDVTILGGHANGLPKELYEPLWEEICNRTKSKGLRIRSIWMADVAQQGRSGVINENILGNDPNWFDHARDLLHLINVKRTEMPQPIVGIGHSMGGTQLVQLSLMHPRLLHALVLLDPVIQKPKTQLEDPKEVFDHKLLISTATRLSAHRRDQWSSRQEAAESLSKSPFYQAWDKRVLARWIEYGLRDLPTPSYRLEKKPDPAKGLPVTLTTTTQQEVATFARPTTYNHATGSANSMNPTTHPDLDPALITSFPFYRPEPSIVFEQLPRLRASVLYIFGGKSHMCNHLLRMEKLRHTGIGIGGSGGTMAGRVKEVLFAEYGHLIAQEAVDQCAEAAVEWLGSEREHWEAEKLGSRAFSNGKSRVEETKVDGELRKAIPPIKRDGSGSGDRNSAPKL